MKFFLTTLIALNISLIANELAWVDEQIQAIKPSRNGLQKDELNNILNPFIGYQNTSVVKEIVYASKQDTKSKKATKKKFIKPTGLKLTTIINQSVRINNRWYKQNKTVGKYTIKKVNHNNVILTYKDQNYILSLYSKKNKLKIRK